MAAADRFTGKLLARNAAFNLFGWGLPMVAALVAVPFLIRGLGEEQFGILTIGWAILGYFGLFDLGLGRALTKLVAERLGSDLQEEVPTLVWTALLVMFLLGALGAAVLALVAPWLVGTALKISPSLTGEALQVLYLLALSLPWVIGTTGLSGVLEANQSFGLVSALRIPMGLFSYLAPLAVLPFSSSLVPVIAVLVAGRIAASAAFLFACLRSLPMLRSRPRPRVKVLGSLAQLGGWMTVSNMVSPLMTYLDRFLIGGLISMAAVAYYVTPYELVTKLWLVPTALLGVLFPAFAATYATDPRRTSALMDRGFRAVFLLMFPVALVIVMYAREGMTLWLDAEFARHSYIVLRWLAVGVFINCLGQVPFALLQGIGRPDITGKLHLAELPFYAAAIWLLSRSLGLEGVALAWVLRVSADTTILYLMAARYLPEGRRLVWRALQRTAPALAALGIAMAVEDPTAKVMLLPGMLVVFSVVGWFRILGPTERAMLLRRQPLMES